MASLTCPSCGKSHEIENIEPSLRRPDPFLEVPVAERAFRTIEGKDLCAVRDADERNPRYFVRALLPFDVIGRKTPCSWGLWVEVSERSYNRIRDLWLVPDQSDEPPMDGRLANNISGYESTMGLRGWLQLVGPQNIPLFQIHPAVKHPFAEEQRVGVSEQQVLLWLSPFLHRQ